MTTQALASFIRELSYDTGLLASSLFADDNFDESDRLYAALAELCALQPGLSAVFDEVTHTLALSSSSRREVFVHSFESHAEAVAALEGFAAYLCAARTAH